MRTLVLLVLVLVSVSAAQERLPLDLPFPAPEGVRYDPAFPLPRSVLGREVGTAHTRPDELVRWFETVGAASDRVQVGFHGRTHERRRLVHAIVTSTKNHARLEALRRANLRLSDSPADVGDEELSKQPVVVWLGYNVHGNEASASEAALLTLYHLAAGRGASLDALLDEAIILVIPDLNPDGHDRFCDWVNGQRGKGATEDTQDREHREPWPGGRTNHYLFDLNRDWLPAVHPETRGRLALWHSWRPHLSLDFHEMGSDRSYFFQPGIPSRNNPLTPPAVYELTQRIATHHAAALDALRQPYYTKESYDDFYVGKGSTYPDVNGGVGILFEQASARSLKRRTSWGPLSYGRTIRNQVATSLSSLRAARALRQPLLEHQRRFYRESASFANSQKVKAWAFPFAGQQERVAELCTLLARHRIHFHAIGAARSKLGDGIVVPVRQPQARLVQALMESVRSFSDTLFYDVSTWPLPLAFGLEHRRVEEDPAPWLGERLDAAPHPQGHLENAKGRQGWMMRWNRGDAPRALIALHRAGVLTRLVAKETTLRLGDEETSFDPGTIFIPGAQPTLETEEMITLLDEVVASCRVDITGIDSGLALSGVDLGSPSFLPLPRTRVALLAGEGTQSYRVGEFWHELSERRGLDPSLLEARELADRNLNAYDLLILPPGDPVFGEEGEAALRAFVRRGGILIATQGAARWVLQKKLAPGKLRSFDAPSTFGVPWSELPRTRGEMLIGGAAFAASFDPTHPLAFGIEGDLPLFRTDTTCLELPERGGILVGHYGRNAWLSGYAAEERRDQIRGSAALLCHRVGRGKIILFADNPVFRGFWRGSARLFMNCVLFSRSW